MKWSLTEIEKLLPILEQMQVDLRPLEGKSVLVLCSAAGDVALWLGKKMKHGQVMGLELNEELLEAARLSTKKKGLESVVKFRKAEKKRIPLPDETFDMLVSEFIIFPAPVPTEIGLLEMARVLRPGGKMVLTDVILTKPIPQELRAELLAIGLDYLCNATQDDFRRWMEAAGLKDVKVLDFTTVVRKVWEQRRDRDTTPERRRGYSLLLEDPEFRLGEAIFYIYVRGEKSPC
jgi:SAM-dependent methyltransferase